MGCDATSTPGFAQRETTAGSIPPRWLAAGVAATTLFIVIGIWSGDARLATLCLLGAACALLLRNLDGRLRFSFGQGFLGYRPDGWPIGVQEDDDIHWSWQTAPTPPADEQLDAELRELV